MIFLTKQQIVDFNAILITQFGGAISMAGDFMHESSLDYLVEFIGSKDNLNPDKTLIAEIASLYISRITNSHIFMDGNKRTGAWCALYFIRLNRGIISASFSSQDVIDLAFKVARKEMTENEVANLLYKIIT